MLWTWVLMVLIETTSSLAISGLERPAASRRRTRLSWGLSGSMSCASLVDVLVLLDFACSVHPCPRPFPNKIPYYGV